MKRHGGSTILEAMCALLFVVLIVSAALRMDTLVDSSHQRTDDYFEMQLASINLAETLIQDIQNGIYIVAEDYSYRTQDMDVSVSIDEHLIYDDYLYLITASMKNIDSEVEKTITFFLRGGVVT